MARQFARGGPRRKTQWGGFANAAGAASLPTLTAVAVGTSVVLSNGLVVAGSTGFFDEEVTITRMIGMWTAQISSTTADTEGTIAVGLAVARGEAILAGVASLPSLEDDPDFEWLYYGSAHLRNPNSVLQDGPINAIHVPFDVRGQRVLRSGSTVVWLAEAEETSMIAGVTGRALVKLA